MTPIVFHGSTEALLVTRTGFDGWPNEPVAEFQAVVYAEDIDGNRRQEFQGTPYRTHALAQERADRIAHALQARLDGLGKLPVGFAHWESARPAYGSPAYLDYGQADDLATEAREAADEAWGG